MHLPLPYHPLLPITHYPLLTTPYHPLLTTPYHPLPTTNYSLSPTTNYPLSPPTNYSLPNYSPHYHLGHPSILIPLGELKYFVLRFSTPFFTSHNFLILRFLFGFSNSKYQWDYQFRHLQKYVVFLSHTIHHHLQ